MTEITLDQQIKCAYREIGMRKKFYPRYIANDQMSQATADHEIAAMEAVYATLKNLKAETA